MSKHVGKLAFFFLLTIVFSLRASGFEEMQELFGKTKEPSPLFFELLESPVMERLKGIDQSGITRYLHNLPSFRRYDHSLGVYIILDRFGASFEECIAGLLHDTSHTVFSHVGDFLFELDDTTISHQDKIHSWYLSEQNVEPILEKYGLAISEVDPKSGKFIILEQELPDMCADRIEYNLHTAYLWGLITQEDIEEVLQDLSFERGKWFFNTPKVARGFAEISLHFNQTLWAGPMDLLGYHFCAEALRRAIELNVISLQDIYFSTDAVVLAKLNQCNDAITQSLLNKSKDPFYFYTFCEEAESDLFLKGKFRGIDPLVLQEGELVRLTAIDEEFAEHHKFVEAKTKKGFYFKRVLKHVEYNRLFEKILSDSLN